MNALTAAGGANAADATVTPLHPAARTGDAAPRRSGAGTRSKAPQRARSLPQVVSDGPRTADVLRFHRPTPEAPAAGVPAKPRTSGSTALAPEPAQRPARRLHALPSPNEAEEVRKLAAAITRAAMEVLAGTRPLQQLAPWLHRDLLGPIQLRADLSRAGGARPETPRLAAVHRAAAVKSVRASLVEPGVYEAAVVVADAARCRAVALRLEAAGRSGWQVTALEIG